MTPELRAAAERLLQGVVVEQGDGYEITKGPSPDVRLVAEAVLSDHHDDDETPVDWKWLTAHASEVKHYTPNVDPTAGDFHGPTDEHGNFLFVRIQNRIPGWFVSIFDGIGSEIYVSCGPLTRRAVRRLLDGLGVVVKEVKS